MLTYFVPCMCHVAFCCHVDVDAGDFSSKSLIVFE